MNPPPHRPAWPRALRITTELALLAAIALYFCPIHSRRLNLLWLLLILISLAGAFFLLRHRKRLRLLPVIAAAACLIPFLMPGADIDADELRSRYVEHMRQFSGTRYVWGGESAIGIDCSGLPRRALRNALLDYGWKHLNGRAFRLAAQHWWFDASAQKLATDYRHYTVAVTPADAEDATRNIRSMSYDPLQPGDMAVTTNGVHVMVYLEDSLWIQADPTARRVIVENGRSADNGWFQNPVTLRRWSILQTAGASAS